MAVIAQSFEPEAHVKNPRQQLMQVAGGSPIAQRMSAQEAAMGPLLFGTPVKNDSGKRTVYYYLVGLSLLD